MDPPLSLDSSSAKPSLGSQMSVFLLICEKLLLLLATEVFLVRNDVAQQCWLNHSCKKLWFKHYIHTQCKIVGDGKELTYIDPYIILMIFIFIKIHDTARRRMLWSTFLARMLWLIFLIFSSCYSSTFPLLSSSNVSVGLCVLFFKPGSILTPNSHIWSMQDFHGSVFIGCYNLLLH